MVSFAKNRVHHVRKPNLHTQRLKIEGEKIKIKVCTACKREIRQAERAVQKKLQAQKKRD